MQANSVTVYSRFRVGERSTLVPLDSDVTFDPFAFKNAVREGLRLPLEFEDEEWSIFSLSGDSEVTAETFEISASMLVAQPSEGSRLNTDAFIVPNLTMDRTPVQAVLGSQMTAVSMLCEILDNSIEYSIAGNDEPSEVRCCFGAQDDYLLMHDNGTGIAPENLQLWLRAGRGAAIQGGRGGIDEVPFNWETASSECHVLATIDIASHLAGEIGKFGVGAKKALYALGEHVELRTRCKDEPLLRLEHMHSKDARADDPWDAEFSVRSDLQRDPRQHFTDIGVTGVRVNSGLKGIGSQKQQQLEPKKKKSKNKAALMRAESSFDLLCTSLAKIYFFYTHGPRALYDAIERTQNDQVKASKKKRGRIEEAGPISLQLCIADETLQTLWSTDNVVRFSRQQELRKWPTSEVEFFRLAKASFPFELVISDPKEKEEHCKLTGVFFYYPVEEGNETLPDPDNLFGTEKAIDGRDGEKSGIYYYWNGKLLQAEDSLCSSLLKQQPRGLKVPKRLLDNRVRGFIFLPQQVPVTDDKTRVRETGLGVAKHFSGLLKELKKALDEWVLKCHADHDQETVFEGERVLDPERQISIYKSVSFSGKHHKKGDAMKFTIDPGENKVEVSGRVVEFFHHGSEESFEGFATVNYEDPESGRIVEATVNIAKLHSITGKVLDNWEKKNRTERGALAIARIELCNLAGKSASHLTESAVEEPIGPWCVRAFTENGKDVTDRVPSIMESFVLDVELFRTQASPGKRSFEDRGIEGDYDSGLFKHGAFKFSLDEDSKWECAGKANVRLVLKLQDTVEQERKHFVLDHQMVIDHAPACSFWRSLLATPPVFKTWNSVKSLQLWFFSAT